MSSPDYLEPFTGWNGLHANTAGQLFSPQEGGSTGRPEHPSRRAPSCTRATLRP